jgi:excisionase family DNA binding protein
LRKSKSTTSKAVRTTVAAPDQLPVLLTISEVATHLSVSSECARRLCTSGKLPFINVGTGSRIIRRVRVDTLDAFMRAERRNATIEEIRRIDATLAAANAVEQRW